MTQQYQHIDFGYGVKIYKMTPKMRKLWAAHEARMGRLTALSLVNRGERDKQAFLAPPAKHALLMPPYVKEER